MQLSKYYERGNMFKRNLYVVRLYLLLYFLIHFFHYFLHAHLPLLLGIKKEKGGYVHVTVPVR